ncbi:MAG TPA: Na/Pi symporter [Nitrospira sp.]|nr:Na/Pi symporter [Nitrospira sp.]
MIHLLEIAATLLAGLGLFFVGLKEISRQLTAIGSARLRDLVAKASANSAVGAVLGVVSGFFTQSGRTTSYVVASLVHTGVLSVRRAMPVVLWANTGCSLLTVAAFLPTESLILLLVGLAGLSFAYEFPSRWRNVSGALFSFALILLGLLLIKRGSSELLTVSWAATLFELIGDSGLAAFVTGTLLTLIAQSHIAVILLAIVMAQPGIYESEHIFMQVYGTYAGTAVLTYVLGMSLKGVARQVVMAQVLYNLVGTALFVGLFYSEELSGIPLVQAAAARVSAQISVQTAFVAILFSVVTSVLLTLAAKPYQALIARVWPPKEQDMLSHTRYITEDALKQPETAILLAEKEHLRLAKRFPSYLDAFRTDRLPNGQPEPSVYHAAFLAIGERLTSFLRDALQHTASVEFAERLLNVRNRQDLLKVVEEDLLQQYEALRASPGGAKAAQLCTAIVEALDTILQTTLAAAETGDREELALLGAMTADRGEMMERIRKKYLATEEEVTAEDRALILHVTHGFERIVWSLARYGELLARNATR